MLTIEHVRELLANRGSHRDTLAIDRDEAVNMVEQFNVLRNQWSLYNQAQQSLTEATLKLDLVKARETERINLNEKVQFLNSLAPTHELYKQYIEKQAVLKTLEQALSDAEERVKLATQHETKCLEVYSGLEGQAESIQAKRTTLAQFQQQAEKFDELDVLKKEFSTLHSSLEEFDSKKSEDALAKQRELVETLENDLESSRKQLQDKNKFLEATPVIQGQLNDLHRYSELLEEISKVQKEIDDKGQTLVSLDEIVQVAKVHLERLEHLMQEGLAFELVHLVVDNEPCPVCGSTDHPQLAAKPEIYPTKDEIEEARIARDAALQKQASEVGQQKTLVIRLDELTKQVDAQVSTLKLSIDGFSEKKFASVQQDLLAKMEQLTALRGKSELLSKTIADKEHKLKVARDKLATLELAHNELLKNLHDLEIRISSVQANIDALSKTLPTTNMAAWQKQLESLDSDITVYDEQVKVGKTNLDAAREQLNAKRGRLETLSSQVKEETKNFNLMYKNYTQSLQTISLGEDDFVEALRDIKEIETYRTQLHALDEAFNKAQAVYDAALKVAETVVKPSETVSDEIYATAVAHRDTLVGNLAAWDKETKHIETTLTSLETLETAMGEAREKVKFLSRLNDLANGGEQGFKNVTFERYVLGAILDEVVYAANLRLQKMSRNRYSLERSDYTGGGRGKQGLDLAVMDAFTGQSRPANTLSGGETFLASMALALGLADVIQSYAGGIHMDTMFIDEGFGTLDPDTLELAMETLVQLQSSGRLIGMISHVPELKSRIPAHLEVIRGDDGSTAKFVIN